MAKAPNKPQAPKEEQQLETTAPSAKKAKAEGDGFDENNKNKNKIFEEWRGEISIEEKGRGDRKTSKRFFTPLVKVRQRVKITQREADLNNIGAASTPSLKYVIMYLPEGSEQGKRTNVNDIVDGAWDETGGEGND